MVGQPFTFRALDRINCPLSVRRLPAVPVEFTFPEIPEGDLVEYVHMGYGSRYERNLILTLENGLVVGTRILADEAYQRELESQYATSGARRSRWPRLRRWFQGSP